MSLNIKYNCSEKALLPSEVLVGLGEAESFLSVDDEVASVNVVALHDHFEDFRLMDSAFLHEADDLVLDSNGVINVVIKLNLDLIFQLTVLLLEVFFVDGVSEVVTILSDEVDLAVVGPRVESITHGVLCPNADVFATSKE